MEAGWNAVFLDAEPFPYACKTQFAGAPIKGVWARRDDGSSFHVVGPLPQSLTDDEELWRVYYPSGTPENQISDLFDLEAGRAYLIEASEAFTWSFVGRPLDVDREWKTGSLNLVGFYADAGSPPTFEDFVEPETEGGTAEVYDLDTLGGWTRIVDLSATMEPGKAYLARGKYKEGAGAVRPELGDGKTLEFPRGVNQQTLLLTCDPGRSRTITLSLSSSISAPTGTPSLGQDPAIPSAGDVAARWRNAEKPTDSWQDLPATIEMDGDATPELEIRIAIDRLSMAQGDPDDLYQSILTVNDGAGYERPFGVQGENLDPTGLWVGTVTSDAVSQPFLQGIEQDLEYTPASTEFRILLHVDSDGNIHLVDESTQIFRPLDGHPEGGEFILATRSLSEEVEAELSAGLKQGTIPKPLRVSAVNFDLRDADNNPVDLPVAGTFIPGSNLEVTVVLYDENPTNPFHHKFHPDHTWFENPMPSQIWDVSREISLFLDPQQSSDEAEAGWGDSWLRGTYEERITGIHEYPIKVGGTVLLRHISRIGALNGE